MLTAFARGWSKHPEHCPVCGERYSCRCTRTRKQQREAIRAAVLAAPLVPDREIARRVGTDHKTVASVRVGMIANEEIPQSLDRPYQRRPNPPWGRNSNAEREAHDFYTTPAVAVHSLLDRESFHGTIWEPACGLGNISKVLAERLPHCEVISTDLIDRGYGSGNVDFLQEELVVDNLVTNPPYQIAVAFAKHALESTRDKVALLLPLYWLEGVERGAFLQSSPLRTVYVFSRRIQCNRGGSTENEGRLPFAWFIWQQDYQGEPVIRWLLPDRGG